MKNKNVYLWTGNGWGKTTSALGVGLRAIGHGQKVIIIQFMKGRKYIGEYKVRNRLKPNYEIYQFGRENFVDLKNPSEKDRQLARKGFEFAKKMAKRKPNLLILDEINLAVKIGLLDINEVLKFLSRIPKTTNVYLTGRYAPKKMIEKADYVTNIQDVKHPQLKRTDKPKVGIDF
jgi:cob(I)alamin adenosyltransferase